MSTQSGISPVMEELAAYIAGAPHRALPDEITEKTKHHVLDTVAAMVSGLHLPPGRIGVSYVVEQGGTPESSVPGTRHVTSAVNAALAGGMLAHSDETDDSHAPSLSHPGCGIVPAALAMAEKYHRSGTSLLRAVALGYDVGCRLTMSLHPEKFRSVGHSTHTFGPMFGAAAAAAALVEVTPRQARHTLSFVAQQASGLSCWMRDPDHIEKAFDFGGMPARNGVAAATMVAHGFTGVEDVFSGDRNFYVAYDETERIGVSPQPERLVQDLGSTYEVANTTIKRWSVGSPIQAVLDGLEELIRREGIDADEVEELEVRVSHQGANTVDNREMPSICLQHLCAVMLIDGTVTFDSAHDETRMADPVVRALREKVRLYGDDELTRAMPSRQAIVELTATSGRRHRLHVTAVLGTTDRPMSWEQVRDKCAPLLAPSLGDRGAEALCEFVDDLDSCDDLTEIRRFWS